MVAFALAALAGAIGMVGLLVYYLWEHLLRPIVRALVCDDLLDR